MTGPDPNPSGLCCCGCGERTGILTRGFTDRKGIRYPKGSHRRWILGHQAKHKGPEYLVEAETGCWIWQMNTDRAGYGRVGVKRRLRSAHKTYWERIHGPVPPGRQLDHLCRRTSCVNPEHLELVTPAINSRRRPSNKLNDEKVRLIRQLTQQGHTKAQIAQEFKVSQATIGYLLRGKTWKGV